MRRRLLAFALFVGLSGAAAITGYTQRSGPTAEDKTLAAELVRKALDDTQAIANLTDRGGAIAEVLRGAEGMKESLGEMALRREVALDLLHQAFTEALGSYDPESLQDEAFNIYWTARDLDKAAAEKWPAEIEDEDTRARFEVQDSPYEDTSPSGVAEKDLAAALTAVEEIEDPVERASAKLALAEKLAAARISTTSALRLAEQAATLAGRAESPEEAARLRVGVARAHATLGRNESVRPLLSQAMAAVAAVGESQYYQVSLYMEIAELAEGGGGGGWGPFAYLSSQQADESTKHSDIAREAMVRATRAALDIAEPEMAAMALEQVARARLRSVRPLEGKERSTALAEALTTVRQVPTDNNARTGVLSEAATLARKTDLALTGRLLDEALGCSSPAGESLNTALGRASLIANAALAGDKRCWEWAAADAKEVRDARWVTGPDETQNMPSELAKAMAETAVLGATFGSGDLQRAKRFVREHSQLGGYEAAEAVWSASIYVWDPSLAFDISDKLLIRLQSSTAPVRGCVAALAAIPAFAHRLVVSESDAYERALPLWDQALQLATTSPSAVDRSVSAGLLCAAVAAVDPDRAAAAAGAAEEGLRAMDDQDLQDDTATVVCPLVAVGHPQAAAELTEIVGDPHDRARVRLSTAKAMVFDFSSLRKGL